jgi:hemolysin activation/secretion protein
LITSQGGGARFTLPLREFSGVRSSLSFGIEAKNWQSQNNSTNLTYFQLYALDPFGNRVLEGSQTIPLPTSTSETLTYAPLELGWSGSWTDSRGSTAFSLGQNLFLPFLESSRSGFEQAAGSLQAGGFFTTVNGMMAREQSLPGGWSASLKANGQYASEPLPTNEQFALGGAAGVRGYEDGEEYGNSGWQTQFDLRAPVATVNRLPNSHGPKQMRFRASVFMDYGENWRTASGAGDERTDQWGTGFGVFMTAGEHFDARFTIAWALLDTPLSQAGNARAYFRVGFQF